MRRPFRRVPLVEPRSVIIQAPHAAQLGVATRDVGVVHNDLTLPAAADGCAA